MLQSITSCKLKLCIKVNIEEKQEKHQKHFSRLEIHEVVAIFWYTSIFPFVHQQNCGSDFFFILKKHFPLYLHSILVLKNQQCLLFH